MSKKLYRYFLTQRPVSPGCQPAGFATFEDIDGGELTNGKRCYGYVCYTHPLSDEDIEAYELTPEEGYIRLREYKPLAGWEKFSEATGKYGYTEYAQPGDEVDRETFNHFMDVLPPASLGRGYLQMGEQFSHRRFGDEKEERGTYITFIKRGDRYFYCGDLPLGWWLNERGEVSHF